MLTSEQVLEVQQAAVGVIVEPSIINYITAIVSRTRNWHSVAVGASPRAGVNILLAARAAGGLSWQKSSSFPDDVKELSPLGKVAAPFRKASGGNRRRSRPTIYDLARILDAVRPARQRPPLAACSLYSWLPAALLVSWPAVAAIFVDLAPATVHWLHGLGVALNLVIFGAALLDLAVSPSLRRINVEAREMSDVMSVGARNAVRIWLTNRNRQNIKIDYHIYRLLRSPCAATPTG